MKGVLRAAWHLTTVFLFGMALLLMQQSHSGHRSHHTLLHIALAFFAAALLLAVITRGRHFAWVLFAVIGALALVGSF